MPYSDEIEPVTNHLPAYLVMIDAGLLIRQHRSFLRRMSVDQRRAWGREAVAVMEMLSEELRSRVPSPSGTLQQHTTWVQQMEDGKRPVSYKLVRPSE